MTPREINKSSIVEYLATRGIHPAKKFHGYYMYYSPLRSGENTPSFKVSLQKNLFIDFATNEGGTLIDLILKLNSGYTVARIVAEFNQSIFSFHQPKVNESSIETPTNLSKIKVIRTDPIETDTNMCTYLESRGIDFEKASDYVFCITYEVKSFTFKGIATKNIQGGYNITYKNFKCVTKQGPTLYSHSNRRSLILTEGIMDLLSFIMIYPEQVGVHDFCVLNSVNNLSVSYDILKKYKQIFSFLDNDRAGDRATIAVQEYATSNDIYFFDYRRTYMKYKDLNDLLMGIPM